MKASSYEQSWKSQTPEFIQLANENNILSYSLLAHLTHCMQPLDVGCFQPYKHWHDVVIKNALTGLEIEYGLRSFLWDLEKIREQTFKKHTIKHAFQKSGIYSSNLNQCLKQLKIFSPPVLQEKKSQSVEDDYLPPGPILSCPPQTAMEVEAQFSHWEFKFTEQCSSPSCSRYRHLFKVLRRLWLAVSFRKRATNTSKEKSWGSSQTGN
jgi:hypothetical protein